MEQVHRGAVAKRMWRDPLGSRCLGTRATAVRQCLRTRCSSASRLSRSPRIDGNSGLLSSLSVADPRRQQFGRVAAKRRGALLPALAHAADMRAATEHHVAAPQAHQFGCPQAGLDREQEQRMIAPSRPCRAIRCRQQRRDLFGVEERHRALHIALVGHGEDALAVQQPGRIGHRDVAEERADRGEPGVAAARAVTARGLAMDEEVGDQIGVDVLDRELDWRLAVPSTRDTATAAGTCRDSLQPYGGSPPSGRTAGR